MNKKRLSLTTGIIAGAMLLSLGLWYTIFKNAVHTGTAEGYEGEITVKIEVEDGKIVDGEIAKISDSEFAIKYALDILNEAINKGTPNQIDAIAGATITSNGVKEAILEAYNKALEENQ